MQYNSFWPNRQRKVFIDKVVINWFKKRFFFIYLFYLILYKRTFYQSLHNICSLPEDLKQKLIIQSLDRNEGTTKYTKIVLKPSKKSLIDAGSRKIVIENSEIVLYDTRGQILMDEREVEQLNLMLNVKTKKKRNLFKFFKYFIC
jgi:hypothetical protein